MRRLCYPIFSFFIIVALSNCERKPFVNHKLKLEPKGDCSAATQGFRMVSNVAGERYEFDKCLPADYDKKKMVVERKGDTVAVSFTDAGNASTRAYQVTLDIDSYPRYNFLTIDNDTYTIVPSTK